MDPAKLDSNVYNFTAPLDLRFSLMRLGTHLNAIDVIARQTFKDVPTLPRGDRTSERRNRKIKYSLIRLHNRILNIVDIVLGVQSMYQAGLVSRSGNRERTFPRPTPPAWMRPGIRGGAGHVGWMPSHHWEQLNLPQPPHIPEIKN